MKNPYTQFAEWGRIGGRLGQRLLAKAKKRGLIKRPQKVEKRGRPKGMSPHTSERNKAIAEMFQNKNMTLIAIGEKFGMTRERVRQILFNQGISHEDGRLYKTLTGRMISVTAKKEKDRQSRLENSCQRYLDCSPEMYTEVTGKKYSIWKNADKYAKAYWNQKHNADCRGISWELTFPEWMMVWRESGKLEQRGRGQDKYVMGRYGDTDGYKIGNIVIIPSTENNSDRIGKKK